jgi:hypothetical protein
VSTATIVNPGLFLNLRSAYLKSCASPGITVLRE